jgi:hypothetical protein
MLFKYKTIVVFCDLCICAHFLVQFNRVPNIVIATTGSIARTNAVFFIIEICGKMILFCLLIVKSLKLMKIQWFIHEYLFFQRSPFSSCLIQHDTILFLFPVIKYTKYTSLNYQCFQRHPYNYMKQGFI